MHRLDSSIIAATTGADYRGLYKAGAAAALAAALIFRRNLDAEWLLLRGSGLVQSGPAAAPETISAWFMLLQQNKLLGITLLNFFDVVNYALVGLIFLALYAALRRTNPSWMLIAAALGYTGVSVYLASNQAFSMLSLSRQYAAATSDAQRTTLLAAGQAVLAIHQNASYSGAGIYPGFLFVTAAGLIISLVMLQGKIFNKTAAYMGILANGFGASYYILLVFTPGLVFIPISISAIFLLIWYVMIGIRLWALGSH
jgi:hypothetical protein